jgi:hypothetical protein
VAFSAAGRAGKKRQISLDPFQGYFFSVPSRVMPLFDKFLASVVAAAASAVETCEEPYQVIAVNLPTSKSFKKDQRLQIGSSTPGNRAEFFSENV